MDQLQHRLDRLQQGVRIVNAGVSGDTTSGGLLRIDRALEIRPELVILELGANDAILGSRPEQTKQNLDLLIRKCLEAGAGVLLAGVKPPMAFSPGYCDDFAALYVDLAQDYGLKLFPDFLHGILNHPEHTLADGIHPNTQGIARIVSNILPVVLESLQEVRAS